MKSNKSREWNEEQRGKKKNATVFQVLTWHFVSSLALSLLYERQHHPNECILYWMRSKHRRRLSSEAKIELRWRFCIMFSLHSLPKFWKFLILNFITFSSAQKEHLRLLEELVSFRISSQIYVLRRHTLQPDAVVRRYISLLIAKATKSIFVQCSVLIIIRSLYSMSDFIDFSTTSLLLQRSALCSRCRLKISLPVRLMFALRRGGVWSKTRSFSLLAFSSQLQLSKTMSCINNKLNISMKIT